MKFKGKKIPGPKPVYAVIPRGSEDDDIVFKITPVIDLKDFEKMCPEPAPDRVLKPGGVEYLDYESVEYKARVDKYSDLQFAYVFIRSISETDYLEWDKVKLDDPSTWVHWKEEIEESGLSKAEVTYLMGEVTKANIIDEERIKEARDRFFSKKQGTKSA